MPALRIFCLVVSGILFAFGNVARTQTTTPTQPAPMASNPVSTAPAASATPANAVPANPDEFMRQAADAMSLTAADMKPWHLRAKYAYSISADGTGKKGGTYEIWWAGPDRYSAHSTGRDFDWTEYRTDKGSFYTGSGPRYGFEVALLLHPLPSPARLAKVTFVAKNATVRGIDLNCLTEMPRDAQSKLALVNSYCFSPSASVARISLDSYGNQTIWNGIVRVHGHYLAKQIVRSSSTINWSLTIDVDQIDGQLGVGEASLLPPADAKPMPVNKVAVASALMAGNKISGANPSYPATARSVGAEGTVVLMGTIDEDGIVKDLKVVSGPTVLQPSALDAVKTWRYRPYLLNGEPVEVQTTINLVFRLGN